jgi:hypothetical protein
MTTCVAACRMCWKYVVKTELIVMCNRLQGDDPSRYLPQPASLRVTRCRPSSSNNVQRPQHSMSGRTFQQNRTPAIFFFSNAR